MAAKKHFLNVRNRDLKNPGSDRSPITRPGDVKQIELSFNKSRSGEPNLVWHVERAESDDSLFLPPPDGFKYQFTSRRWNQANTKLYYEMAIPSHFGGVEYTINVKLGTARSFKQAAKFVTWRRVALGATCPNEACAKLFEAAVPKVAKAFAPAYIEVVRNGVYIDEGGGKQVVTRHPTRRGVSECTIEVSFGLPRWESFGQKFELDVTSTSLEGHRLWSREDDLLVLDIGSDDKFRPQVPSTHGDVNYIEAITVTCVDDDNEVLLAMPARYGFFPETEARAYRQLCKIRRDGTAVTEEDDVHAATDMVLDLGSEPMREAKARMEQGKTIHISTTLGLEQFGRTAGGAVPGNSGISLTFYPESTSVERMTSILTHEMAHTMRLVRAAETTHAGVRVDNIFFHDNAYGGQGNHCRQGSELVDSELTPSGSIYEPDDSLAPLCTMHYKLDDRVVDGKFCKNCIAQLRRAEMPR